MLLKTRAGSDNFVAEKYHDQIAAVLAAWSSSLLNSPSDVRAIENVMARDFSGASLKAVESRLVRSGGPLEIRQNKFAAHTPLSRDSFLRELRSAMRSFSKILTAEFQVTSIEPKEEPAAAMPRRLHTSVRFELIATGPGFYREQRVGTWGLEWVPGPAAEFQLQRWLVLEESVSRCLVPAFADITATALAGNASYSAQMMQGADYWRTVLDAASGIDIYGHNGISVADVDNDGFDDLYVCQAAGLPNRLYRNRGDGTFQDITEDSGLGILENTACALFADFDNDGRQDVILVCANGPLLFVNEGGSKFRRRPDAFRFATAPQGTFTGAAVADYDRDGWLDIYFCLYAYYQGTDQYKYPVPYHDAENGPPNFMMRNNRDGTFRDVTAESGLNQKNTRYSFCCGWSDFNGDGWPDLYVVNDFGRKNLYRNNGDGTFTDAAPAAGVEDVGAGMSVCWLDYSQEGSEAPYVANMWTAAGQRVSRQDIFKKDSPPEVRALYQKHAMGNSLFENSGGRFYDTTAAAGVGMGRWSWSSDAWDFDHDGFPDIYLVNGMVSGLLGPDLNSFFWRQVVANSPDQARPSHDYEQGWNAINELIRADGTWSGFERNVFYANNRDGSFSDVSGAIGLDCREDGRAFALADFDRDGRQELFLKNRNGPQLRAMKNAIPNLPPSISFRLRGTKSNRDAIGARVTVEGGKSRQTRFLQAGSGFLSQHSKELFFGLGEVTGPVRASIRWPSGLVQVLSALPLDHTVWVEEGSEAIRFEPFRTRETPPQQAIPGPPQIETLPATVETWLLSPVPAPDFQLPDVSGKLWSLATLRSRKVLLHVWHSASPTSVDDLKLFNRVYAPWVTMNLQILSMNVDDSGDADKLTAWAREQRFTFPILDGSSDVAAIYNILYRYLFDRHRDLSLPTSFLIDEGGFIVKIYQGAISGERVERDSQSIPRTDAVRLSRALPFPGVADTFDFGRNHLSYGSVFFQRGYFDQAAAAFQQALRDDPTSAEACYGLGSAYLNQQKTAEARESFERATGLKATYPDTLANAWNNLGLIATQENRTGDAIKFFQEALRHSPNHLIALNNLGNAYRQQKSWAEARRTFERALAVSPDDPEAHYGLGMVFAQVDDNTRAYDHLRRSLSARPAYPEALNNLGILYLRTGRRDEAVASFEECVRIAPAFDQSYLNLARVYAVEGELGKARSILQDLLKQHPDHAQAKSMLAQLPQ